MKKAYASLVVVGVFVALTLLQVPDASAWSAKLSSSAVCQNNKTLATFVLDNTSEPEALNVTASNHPDVIPAGTAVVPKKKAKEFYANITGTYTLTVSVNWPSDKTIRTYSTTVKEISGCKSTTTTTTAPPPTTTSTTVKPTTTTTQPVTTTSTVKPTTTLPPSTTVPPSTSSTSTTIVLPTTTTTAPITTTTTRVESTTTTTTPMTTFPPSTSTSLTPTTTSTSAPPVVNSTTSSTVTPTTTKPTPPTSGPNVPASKALSPTAAPKQELAKTGLELKDWISFGVALLVAGLVFFMLARRESRRNP